MLKNVILHVEYVLVGALLPLKIKRIKIENFKSIKKIEFDFKDLAILIGENNSGKTNIMKALQLFFETSIRGINEEDFFGKDIKNPNNQIQITITFDRLTEEELAESRLSKYVFEKQLVVRNTISFNEQTGKFEQKYHGLIKEPKANYLKMSKFGEIKDKLASIVKKEKLPKYFFAASGRVTQGSYVEGRERYIAENSDKLEWDEPFFPESQFQGFKEVAQSYLPSFLYVPAVQEATEETSYSTKNVFGKLLDAMLLSSPETVTEFAEASKILNKAQQLLNQPVQIRELEKKLLKTLQEAIPSTINVKIEVTIPNITELVQKGTSLTLDDGIETSVESKGHGLQRVLILAMFRLYAEFFRSVDITNTKKKPNFVFAVEEPELYLHPQCQRIMFETLQGISEIDQVIFCTHSSFFIDMSHYDSLVVTSKPDPAKGTVVFNCVNEIFSPDEKSYFKMVNEFDPERNELFFAKKVVLVEGDSEKVALPRICKMMDKNLNAQGVSIVECGSKFNLSFFMKVLNAFRILYVVIHDEDPVDTAFTGDKLKEARRLFNENDKIKKMLDPAYGKIEIIQPNFDDLLGLSIHQMRKGKPYAVFKKLQNIQKEQIPERLRQIVNELF